MGVGCETLDKRGGVDPERAMSDKKWGWDGVECVTPGEVGCGYARCVMVEGLSACLKKSEMDGMNRCHKICNITSSGTSG